VSGPYIPVREYVTMRPVRGQSAVEYMMTYGWGIMVVLVAGVLLWQLGFLEMNKNITPDKRGFSQLVPLDWGLASDGTLNIIVQNNAGTIVELNDVDTNANTIANGDGVCTGGNNILSLPDTQLRPGATVRVTFTGCPLQTARVGEYYKINVTIGYYNRASTLTHKSNGVLWGPVG